MCAGNELFYARCLFSIFTFQAINLMFMASLYLAHFTTGPLYMFYILAVVTFPVAVAKSGIALLQVIQNIIHTKRL